MMGISSGLAQTSVGTTTGWIAWNSGLTGNLMADPGADQQTGQGTDDFIGNGSTVPAMMQQAGTLSANTGGGTYILFRARMGKYTSAGFGAGNGANLSLGIDLNDNGSLDLIMDLNTKTSIIVQFAQPGTGANTGPSTTSWGNFAGAITLASYEYDYRQTTDSIVLNSNGTSGTPTDQNGSTASSYASNAWVTFAITYANLQTAVRAYAKDGLTGGTFAGYTLDDLSHLSFIGFTSTQGNAINQDLLGTEKNMNSILTFAQLGATTTYIRPGGGPIPEPSSVYQLGGLLGGGLLIEAWRRRKAGRATPPARAE